MSNEIVDFSTSKRSADQTTTIASKEDTALYIAEMSAELGILAEKAELPMLAYLMNMAVREASNELIDAKLVNVEEALYSALQ